MKRGKKVVLHLIISGIKAGKNPAQIAKENDIKKQKLQYYIRQLKEKGVIQKVGYGTWEIIKEVQLSSKVTITKKQIRGHAFNWKVRFKYDIDWIKRLERNNIKYQLIGAVGTTPRIIFNGKKIWLTKTGLVIYEPRSFFARSSHESKGMAVWELDKTVKALGRRLKIDLNTYQFTTSREHYGMIKNELARQYNNKGEKLFISDDKGVWMWIDFSHGVHELETNKPKNSRGVQNWYNDMKDHKFEVTPSFILDSLSKVTKNFELTQKEIVNLKNENIEMKQKFSMQKDIRDISIPSYIA